MRCDCKQKNQSLGQPRFDWAYFLQVDVVTVSRWSGWKVEPCSYSSNHLSSRPKVDRTHLQLHLPITVPTRLRAISSSAAEPEMFKRFWDFYRAMLCIRGTSHGPVSVCLCLSVCLSVTSRSSTKTAKRRITQTTPHDSPGTLVFCCQRSPRNSIGVTPYEGAECRWGG